MTNREPIGESANRLLAQGRTQDAVTLVAQAAAAGDASALFTAAAWRLVGRPLPRDLPLARQLLRRAVQIGHVDAALMEIALTANGSGGMPDWAGALRLLETASANDPVAAQHLAIVRAMPIDPDGLPKSLPAPERIAASPDIVRFPRLFSPQECGFVAATAGEQLSPATIVDPATGRLRADPVRTSHVAAIGAAHENLVIRALNARIAAISDTSVEQGEALNVLRYAPGQQYRLHLDTIAGADNQRVATVLVYLNEGFAGGETHFPRVGVTITPRGGDAILFRNTLPDGSPDPRAQHAGLPVRQGIKWLATRWIRARPFDPWA